MVLPPSVRRFGWLLSPTYAQFFSGENLSDKTQICSRPLGSAHPNSQRVSRPQLCAWSRDGTSTLAISWSQEENNGGLGMLWVEKNCLEFSVRLHELACCLHTAYQGMLRFSWRPFQYHAGQVGKLLIHAWNGKPDNTWQYIYNTVYEIQHHVTCMVL